MTAARPALAVSGSLRPPTVLAWGVIGLIGWTALGLLAQRMLATQPPTAGFDLELLLEAGRNEEMRRLAAERNTIL
jgi:hypothetical protein